MEESLEQKSIFQMAIPSGVLLGIIHAIVYLALYFFLPSKITGFSYLFFVIVLNFGYTIFKAIEYRKSIGGYLEFGGVFQLTLFTLAISGLIGSLLVPVALSLALPDYAEVVATSQMDTSIYWASKFGAPEESLDQMRQEMDIEKLKEQYSTARVALGYLFASIFYAITAVIVGFIARKSQPIE